MVATPLDRVRRLAASARLAQEKADLARDARDEAVKSAYQAGVPIREIAEAGGMSFQRVSQIARVTEEVVKKGRPLQRSANEWPKDPPFK